MKKLVVLGAGESGVGAAILAQSKGFDTFVSDFGSMKEKYRNTLTKRDIPFEETKHTESLIFRADEVVKSPGIPDNAPIITELKKRNIPIISEIEFAGRYTNAKKICITGSNGKTTTTSLIYYMMQNAGMNVGVAGNIGKSFAQQVAEDNFEYYVIEISSFQLDDMFDFKADVAVLTNITPDHLNRYNYQFQNYINSKFRITQNQTASEFFIYCADDEVIQTEMAKRTFHSKLLPYSLKNSFTEGGFLLDNSFTVKYHNNEFIMPSTDLSLKGKHNAYNSLAVALAGSVIGVRKRDIRESLMTFKGVEHRLEYVDAINGVEFLNDSKATNVDSSWYALESMRKPTIWIVGGQDKGNDYTPLNQLVAEKVKAIVCLGVDNTKIHSHFQNVETIVDTNSVAQAVETAYKLATSGDVVLLSPCCASFDLFENYEDRGRKFKLAVQELKAKA